MLIENSKRILPFPERLVSHRQNETLSSFHPWFNFAAQIGRALEKSFQLLQKVTFIWQKNDWTFHTLSHPHPVFMNFYLKKKYIKYLLSKLTLSRFFNLSQFWDLLTITFLSDIGVEENIWENASTPMFLLLIWEHELQSNNMSQNIRMSWHQYLLTN